MNEIPSSKAIELKNNTCVYCGIVLTQDTSTKEHVIARHFVPKGKLQGSWNLIVKACKHCNGKKCDLEDDISAITMQPDAYGRYGHDDAVAASEGERKGQGSRSRYTGKVVKNSLENMTVEMPLGKVGTISVDFVAPPQVRQERLFCLARFQLMGFFYWITFDESSRCGGFWTGGFWTVQAVRRSDWGNQVQRAFMDAVVQWEPRVLGCTADEFYKVAMKRHPDADCWSWALEWNKSFRLVGFFGNHQAAKDVVSRFPRLEFHKVVQGWSFRRETPLDESKDRLFIN
ncbi:MAG: HNH endonuclease [Rhodothermaceae bacterium]|nr:HNH endonuclease [Rhodothermaceae bacterium]